MGTRWETIVSSLARVGERAREGGRGELKIRSSARARAVVVRLGGFGSGSGYRETRTDQHRDRIIGADQDVL